MTVWGHTGCDAAYQIRLSVCPRCRGVNVMEEIEMPKITKYGGHTNAGLTEKDAGFVDTTAKTTKKAKAKLVGEQGPELVPEPDDPGTDLVPPPFNPGDLSISDVLALRAECTESEWAAVLEAERNGKNRAGILSK